MQEDKTDMQETDAEETAEEENKEVEIEKEKSADEKPSRKENGKIEKLQKALEKAEKERDSYLENYQRTFSEFNNFKKRNNSAIACAMKDGCADTVTMILPVMDNFERALEHAEDSSDEALAEGVLMVYRQLSGILESLGVKEIPAMGEPFDPNIHQAIQQVEAEEGIAENTVVMVVQKGYMLGDKILRHSMVIVSK